MKKLICILLCLMSFGLYARFDKQTYSTLIKTIDSSIAFESRGEQYEILNNISYRYEKDEADQKKIGFNSKKLQSNAQNNPTAQQNKQADESFVTILGNIKLYKQNNIQSLSASQKASVKNDLLFVRNNQRRTIGSVDGSITIVPNIWVDPKSIMSEFNLKKIVTSKKYNIILLKGEANRNLISTYNRLKQDNRFKSVYLNVRESTLKAH